MKTRAAVAWKAGEPLTIETVDLQGPKFGEVLVEIKATGICHTDYYTLSGADPEGLFPAILGHEGAGIVVDVGPGVTSLKKGDHVITCLSVFCGHCEHCLTGHMSLCQEPETKRAADQEPRISKSGAPLQQFANLGFVVGDLDGTQEDRARLLHLADHDDVPSVGPLDDLRGTAEHERETVAHDRVALAKQELSLAEIRFRALGVTPGMRFLLPRAERAREILPEALRAAGAEVDEDAESVHLADDNLPERGESAPARRVERGGRHVLHRQLTLGGERRDRHQHDGDDEPQQEILGEIVQALPLKKISANRPIFAFSYDATGHTTILIKHP